MQTPCCMPVNDLDNKFDQERAKKELHSYWKEGVSKRGKLMLHKLNNSEHSVSAVLDVGCGIGTLHHELLKSGKANHAIGIEASSAYLQAAAKLANDLGHASNVKYKQLDFALLDEPIGNFDIVMLDRVVCCYPDKDALLKNTMTHSDKYVLLSYPSDSWWVRVYYKTVNWFRKMRRSDFFTYFHEPKEIHQILSLEFSREHLAYSGTWQIEIWERRS